MTGANGQLGMCLRKTEKKHSEIDFLFLDSSQLDITNKEKAINIFQDYKPTYCINAAAFTNVEQAERDPETAFLINAYGVKNLVEVSIMFNTVLIHISTDYIFDGNKKTPYKVNDIPNPINQYGKSKLLGESFVKEYLKNYFIVRTSWLYSEFGKNFYKTILEKAVSEEEIFVTDEQKGCPTNANNLAIYILSLINQKKDFGTYHFCDGEAMTWFDFATQILEQNNLKGKVKLVKANNYRTLAARPKNSVLQIKKQ